MSTLVQVILSGTAPGISPGGQFIPVYSGKSLFQLCVERNASFAGRQLVVGHNEYYIYARDYFKSTGNKAYLNIIEEDYLTNIFSVSFAAFSANAEEILLITPSAYLAGDEDAGYKDAIAEMIHIAEEDGIAVLTLRPEQASNNMPFITCEEGNIKSLETPDSKQIKSLLKSGKHFAYSGSICCKAGIYLQQLKTWAPEVYHIAKNAWEARVAQYVAIDINTTIPQVTIENKLLAASDKIKVVLQNAGSNRQTKEINKRSKLLGVTL